MISNFGPAIAALKGVIGHTQKSNPVIMFTTYNAIMCNKFVTYALFTKRTNDLMVGIFKSNVNSYKFIDRPPRKTTKREKNLLSIKNGFQGLPDDISILFCTFKNNVDMFQCPN